MLMTHNYIDQSGATAYAAPEIEIYEMPAEGGFLGSGDFGDAGETGSLGYDATENDMDI